MNDALTKALAKLDDEQRAVAAWVPSDGNLRIVAPAGSGKTQTITTLVAKLIDAERVDPKRVVMLTFGNKAAKVMSSRIGAMLPTSSVPERICTYHRLALRSFKSIAPSKRPAHQWNMANCLDTDGRTRSSQIPSGYVLWRCATEFGKMPGTGKPSLRVASSHEEVQRYQRFAGLCYSASFPSPESLNDYLVASGRHPPPEFGEAWEMVEEAKIKLSAWEFCDVIAEYARLLGDATLPRPFDSADLVVVDETQDNDMVQMQIVQSLIGAAGRVVLVGDGSQGIFSWRGADTDLFLHADKRFNAKTLFLRRNYRSLPPIVELGNAITAKKPWKLGPDCESTRTVAQNTQNTPNLPDRLTATFDAAGEEPPGFAMTTSVQPVIDAIYLSVEGMLNGGASVHDDVAAYIDGEIAAKRAAASDFAVLTRTNAALTSFQASLAAHEIPVTLVGTSSLFEHREIGTFLAWCILSQMDAVNALELAAKFPNRYLGGAFIDSVRERVTSGTGMIAAIEAVGNTLAGEKARRNAYALADDVLRLRALPWHAVHDTVLALLLPKASKDAKLRDGDSPDEDKPALYKAAAKVVGKFPSAEAAYKFTEKCANLARTEGEDAESSGDARVTLSTTHRFKGREARHVFLYCPAGSFPSSRSGPKELEDERRLFYVAVTRAADRLTLVVDGQPSEFAIRYCDRVLRAGGWIGTTSARRH